jgi:hypothetical protein
MIVLGLRRFCFPGNLAQPLIRDAVQEEPGTEGFPENDRTLRKVEVCDGN